MSNECNGSPFKAPTNTVSKLSKVIGLDEDDQSAALNASPGLLYGPDGDPIAQWRDGSNEQPIVMKSLAERSLGGKGVLVKGPAGQLYALVPAEGGRHVLVHDGSSVVMEREGESKVTFNSDDIKTLAGCGFEFAIWEGCNPDGILRLRRIPTSEICRYLPAATEPATLIGCINGGMASIAGNARNSMMVCDGDNWVQEAADLRFLFRQTLLYSGANTIITINWDDLGIPAVGVAGVVLAELEMHTEINGPSAKYVYLSINGGGYCVARTGGGGGYFDQNVTKKFQVTPGSSMTIQGVYSGGALSVNASVILSGFYH